jgi:hypothetical protein
MKKHPPIIKPAVEDSSTPGPLTRKVTREQAKQELLDKPNSRTNEAAPVSAADSEGWGAPPVSTGRHVPVPSGDDEDAEGRSDTERLVVEGVREAGDEQMRAARRPADNNP